MKKSLIALAVAGAMAAPMAAQADATLYGSLRIKVMDNDNVSTGVVDNFSRIGIKGSSDLFSGAKAIYQFEQAIDPEAGSWGYGRQSYIGATGDFGTFQLGRMWTPYALWTLFTTDVLDNGTTGSSGYVIGAHRTPDTIAYITPAMGGFQAAGAVIATDADAGTTDNSVDVSHLAAKYEMGGFFGAVSYLGFEEGDLEDVWSLGLSYTVDALYVGARYEDREFDVADDEDAWELVASYTMGNTKLLANYIDDEADDLGDDDGQQWSIEAQQKLGKQARVFAAYADYGNDVDGIELGYRVDF
ncbi:MAG: porin [Oceanospirillaceae bacterium]|nr:porin [Oceanospirillaceae bacterium]